MVSHNYFRLNRGDYRASVPVFSITTTGEALTDRSCWGCDSSRFDTCVDLPSCGPSSHSHDMHHRIWLKGDDQDD